MRQNYSIDNKLEDFLLTKAQQNNIPIYGVFELTPLCNLNCKMCYVRLSYEEMKKRGKLISKNDWIKIAQEAFDNGTLYLLLTGGEPLTYPDFKQLYIQLSKMGFVITINTNGLLIDDEMVKIFTEYPVRRLNITVYGTDNETYGHLCNDPHGFSKLTKAINLLVSNDIPFRFNYTVTSYNKHCHSEIYKLARKYNTYVAQTTYIFPPVRCEKNNFPRLSPEEAANYIIKGNFFKNHVNSEVSKREAAKNSFKEMDLPLQNYNAGYCCSAGHREYFVNWRGEMFPCGIFEHPRISILENSFSKCWSFLVEEIKELEKKVCNECEQCPKRNICNTCLASRYCETESFSGKPNYLCDMTDAEIAYLYPYLNEEDKRKYKYLLNENLNRK